jgi:hypothetical protein
MSECKGALPLDTKLLGDAIIELNISRHNVSIYPGNHPIVEKSLDRAFDLFLKLFELKSEITLAVAKDTLIIDGCQLDQHNPVYRDFALCLSQKNIASVTLSTGMTRDDLYSFHRFLLEKMPGTSPDDMHEVFTGYSFRHIHAQFVDYNVFTLAEGEVRANEKAPPLWELYVYGLLEGRLMTGDSGEALQKVSPHELAAYINTVSLANLREVNYDNVITTYVRKTSERRFSGGDLKKIMKFINSLRPELKRQFLSSAVGSLSSDEDVLKQCLGEMTADEVVEMLGLINEQMLIIPEALKNVLEKFTQMDKTGLESMSCGNGLIEDDILLSSEITSLLSDANFKSFVSDAYQQEIQRILQFNEHNVNKEWLKQFLPQMSSEFSDRIFSDIILELLMSKVGEGLAGEDRDFILQNLKEQGVQFVETGQFGQVLKILRTFEAITADSMNNDIVSGVVEYFYSPDFIAVLIDAIKIMGRAARQDVFLLCECYGERILLPLMDALVVEESQTMRRFLISLIAGFGGIAAREAANRLNDGRWFVIRNMLFILLECGSDEYLKKARSCCEYGDVRVSFEAVKCLLKARDEHGVQALRKYLHSGDNDLIKKAVFLAGTYRVAGVVPDLIGILRKKAVTGKDLEEKIPLVQALGQIGDTRAHDALSNILQTKSLFFRSALEKLKAETVNALKNLSLKRTLEPAGKVSAAGN